MLILTRRLSESLMIGDEVTVTVLGIKGNQVRIGIDAPRDVEVHREEIYNKIKAGEAAPKTAQRNEKVQAAIEAFDAHDDTPDI